jgi:hypothetical protein
VPLLSFFVFCFSVLVLLFLCRSLVHLFGHISLSVNSLFLFGPCPLLSAISGALL